MFMINIKVRSQKDRPGVMGRYPDVTTSGHFVAGCACHVRSTTTFCLRAKSGKRHLGRWVELPRRDEASQRCGQSWASCGHGWMWLGASLPPVMPRTSLHTRIDYQLSQDSETLKDIMITHLESYVWTVAVNWWKSLCVIVYIFIRAIAPCIQTDALFSAMSPVNSF